MTISEWECNSILYSKFSRINSKPRPKNPGFFFDYFKKFKNSFFSIFLETKIQAELFNIIPSFTILRLFAFKVEPVEVISVINSEEPVNG
jgi:hypothetical protein